LLGISPARRFPKLATRKAKRELTLIPEHPSPRALLFVDALTQSFDPGLAVAAVRVLADAGISVQCVTDGDSGLTWISTGQLNKARREQRRLLDIFARYPSNLPIVVLEPSHAAVLAHDLPELIRDERAGDVARRIRTFTQVLDEFAKDRPLPEGFPAQVVLQPHCHERATFPTVSQADWLRARGIAVTEAVGCCGMGGNFGYEPRHFELSVAVAMRSLLPAIDEAGAGTALLADGFGCRCQVDDLRPAARPQHLAKLLDGLR
jgi:Fe-S oxidoreductase